MAPRRPESPVQRLLEEARSIEVLLSDLAPTAEQVETYWQLSTDMITLMVEIEALAERGGAGAEDPEYKRLRHALSVIESEAMEMMRG